MNNVDNEHDAEIQHLLREMHNMSTRKNAAPHHGPFNGPLHGKASSSVLKKKSSSTVNTYMYGKSTHLTHKGSSSAAAVLDLPRSHGNLSFVQQLQVKYNQAKHALEIQEAQCADLQETISDLINTKSQHAFQVSTLEATIETQGREIRTLRDHVQDLYTVQQTLRAESLQKDIQLQQRHSSVTPAPNDDCHSCVCHSNAPSIAWSNHPDGGGVVLNTLPNAPVDSIQVVQNLRMELDGLETQVASQSAELVRVQAALDEAVERNQVVEDTMRQWTAHLLVRDTNNQTADVEEENLNGLELLHALNEAITHQMSQRNTELDPNNRLQRGRRNAMLVHPNHPTTEEDPSGDVGVDHDDERGAMPKWLVDALATVEDTMDEATHALDMEVLQSELASLRRSLQQKDDELDAFELLMDSMQGQVGALATRRELSQDGQGLAVPGHSTMVEALLHTIYISNDEPQAENDGDDDTDDGLPEESPDLRHDTMPSELSVQGVAAIDNDAGDCCKALSLYTDELPVNHPALSSFHASPEETECLDEITPLVDELAVQPAEIGQSRASFAAYLARVQSLLDNVIAVLQTTNCSDDDHHTVNDVDVYEQLVRSAENLLIHATTHSQLCESLQDKVTDQRIEMQMQYEQVHHLHEEVDALKLQSAEAMRAVESELSRRVEELGSLNATSIAKDGEIKSLESQLTTASCALETMRHDLALTQTQSIAVRHEMNKLQAQHRLQQCTTTCYLEHFYLQLQAEMATLHAAITGDEAVIDQSQHDHGAPGNDLEPAASMHLPTTESTSGIEQMQDYQAAMFETFTTFKTKVVEQVHNLHREVKMLRRQLLHSNEAAASSVRRENETREIIRVQERLNAQADDAKIAMLRAREVEIDELRSHLDTVKANLNSCRSFTALIEEELATCKAMNRELNESMVQLRGVVDTLDEKFVAQWIATPNQPSRVFRTLKHGEGTCQASITQELDQLEGDHQAHLNQLVTRHTHYTDELHVQHAMDRLLLMCESHMRHSDVENEVISWKRQINVMKSKELRMRDELKRCQGDLALAIKEMTTLRVDVTTHEQHIMTLMGENERLRRKLDATLMEIQDLEVKNAYATNELADVSFLLAKERATIDHLKAVEDTLLSQLEHLRHELEQCQHESTTCKALSASSVRDVSRYMDQIAVLERDVADKSDKIKALEDKLSTEAHHLATSRQHLSFLETQHQNLHAQLSTQEAQCKARVDKMHELFESACLRLQAEMALVACCGAEIGDDNSPIEWESTTQTALPAVEYPVMGLEHCQNVLLDTIASLKTCVHEKFDSFRQEIVTLHSLLQGSNDTTADTIRRCDEDRAILQVELASLVQNLQELTTKLRQRDAEIDKLHTAHAIEVANSNTNRSMTALIEDALSVSKSDNHSLKLCVAQLRHENCALHDKLAAQVAIQLSHDEKIGSIRCQLDEALSQARKSQEEAWDVVGKQDQIAQLQEEMASKQQEVGNLLCTLAASEWANGDIQRRWDADKAQMLLEVAACRSECQQLSTLLDEKRSEFDDFLADRLAKEETLVESLHVEFNAMQATYEAQVALWAKRSQGHERTAIRLQHALWAIQLEGEIAASEKGSPTTNLNAVEDSNLETPGQNKESKYCRSPPVCLRSRNAMSVGLGNDWAIHQLRSVALEMELQNDQHAIEMEVAHQDHEKDRIFWQQTMVQKRAHHYNATQQLMQQLDLAQAVICQKEKDITLWMDCTLAMQSEIQELRVSHAQVELDASLNMARAQNEIAAARPSIAMRKSVKMTHFLKSVQLEMDELTGSYHAVVEEVRSLTCRNQQLQCALDEMSSERYALMAKINCLVSEFAVLPSLLANERTTVDRLVKVENELNAELDQLRQDFKQCQDERNNIHQLLKASTEEWSESIAEVKATVRAQDAQDHQECAVNFAQSTATNDKLLADQMALERECRRLRKDVLKWRHVVQSTQLEMESLMATADGIVMSSSSAVGPCSSNSTQSAVLIEPPEEKSVRDPKIATTGTIPAPNDLQTMMTHDLEWTWQLHEQVLDERTKQVHLLQAQLAHTTSPSPPMSPLSATEHRMIALKQRLDAATAENHALCSRLTDLTLDNHRLVHELTANTPAQHRAAQTMEATTQTTEGTGLGPQRQLDSVMAESAALSCIVESATNPTTIRPDVTMVHESKVDTAVSSSTQAATFAQPANAKSKTFKANDGHLAALPGVDENQIANSRRHHCSVVGLAIDRPTSSRDDGAAVELNLRLHSMLYNVVAAIHANAIPDEYHNLLRSASGHEQLITSAKYIRDEVTILHRQIEALQAQVADKQHEIQVQPNQVHHRQDEYEVLQVRSVEELTAIPSEGSSRVEEPGHLEGALAATGCDIKALASKLPMASHPLESTRPDLSLIQLKVRCPDSAIQTTGGTMTHVTSTQSTDNKTQPPGVLTQSIMQTAEPQEDMHSLHRRLGAAMAENSALRSKLADLTSELHRLSIDAARTQPAMTPIVPVYNTPKAFMAQGSASETESAIPEAPEAGDDGAWNGQESCEVRTFTLPVDESPSDGGSPFTWRDLAVHVQMLLRHAADVVATTQEKRHRLQHRLRRLLLVTLHDPLECAAHLDPIVVVVHRLTSLVRTLASLLEPPTPSSSMVKTSAREASPLRPFASVRRNPNTPFHMPSLVSRVPRGSGFPNYPQLLHHHASSIDSNASFVAGGGGVVLLDLGRSEIRASLVPRHGLAAVSPPMVRFATMRDGSSDAAARNVARAFESLGLSATHLAHVKVVLLHKPCLEPVLKEHLTTLLLQGFQVHGINLTTHAQVALMGCHAHTGLVVDIGNSVTHVVPVFEDMVLEHAVVKIDGGGSSVAKHIVAHVRKTNPSKCFQAVSTTACVEAVERRLAEGRRDADWPSSYCDVFFRGHVDLAAAVRVCVDKCDPLLHAAMFGNIVVTGGAASLCGLAERLELEVRQLATTTGRVRVHVAANVFVGAAAHATTLSPYKWVLQPDFRLHGARIVHAKCF
ncbi:hypothetical protein, variant 1 [Aphanomyces invadans]|uniref:Uncharacterized protein n=1 Tax=Aphanomyces invadans TaxID=157072 RepID=A0A024TKF2_9STRA|nr:hypothetical protein, variant 1 [Aphanomyces invadans]ETV94513.1 hypothetical protein, variant 1 [Aphanomyces invadans]|eukprot:XP_008876829.1 hypothetical protein, variant 1 [Aphanomyces invadans]